MKEQMTRDMQRLDLINTIFHQMETFNLEDYPELEMAFANVRYEMKQKIKLEK